MNTLLRGCDKCMKQNTVKRLITGILDNGSTSAVFLCHPCFDAEMKWRREVNEGQSSRTSIPFPIVQWSNMRYLNAETGLEAQ